jgi:hypothetical protein
MPVQPYKPPFPYLKQSQRGTRANKLSMAAPMLARWRYNVSKTYIENLADLVDWMDVENSKRWYPENGNTYCDEYSEDFLDQLFGPYKLPYAASVWWTPQSLELIRLGDCPKILWPTTVKSNGARGLHDWLHDWSGTYGWQVFESEEDFYTWLNTEGPRVGVISTPTHVSVALPDKVNPAIKPKDFVPLQTQAGGTNKKYFRSNSWYIKNKTTIYCGVTFTPPR